MGGQPGQKNIGVCQDLPCAEHKMDVVELSHTAVILDDLKGWEVSLDIPEEVLIDHGWDLTGLKQGVLHSVHGSYIL